ncbi:gamma-glutamyltransferase [Simiduia agarivorans]|uniref:Glutathione hydrolase proenzyme n=1 Tax=Simiduia agarivorans (strain DSM 21679 / JCM 13881 / BCRC 17597 / SA1) TaxID=1117647 RepID=K4KHZ7_SIMAS|nr:gamma-glutamyltransferase [Simiduia agarivorans]AFU97593.2 gamma-glutamyltransferase 1 [Simiduia agarivorans SA1 = DSM 21679]
MPVLTGLRLLFCLVLLLWCTVAHSQPADEPAYAQANTRGAVATVHPLATRAGMDVLAKGGNAVDAAVAAAVALGVVDGHNSGIGGGAFVLIRTADGKLLALDGRETAPAKAHRDMYVVDGEADTSLSQMGPLASGVPGSVLAYEMAIEQAGAKVYADVLAPAIRLAEEGFEIDNIFAGRLARSADRLARFDGSRAVLLGPDGNPWPRGHTLVQKDLANTLKAIADEGSDYFYQGGFARAVDQWMAANGGLLSAADFAGYKVIARSPILFDYRGYQVVGFPPPSSGGVHTAQILGMLEGHDLKALKDGERYHLIGEAMKLAFADRAHWLGDPDFTQVPKALVSRDYIAAQAGRILLNRALDVTEPGDPLATAEGEPAITDEPASEQDLFFKHTTHIAAADAAGNWVAITTTVNTDFGSKVIVPGTGVVMNNQMDDFSVQPGVPNAYGLVGTEANSVQPGKRPLSSMSPTIVLKDGKPVMTVGAAGGPTIITQVVQAIINHLDLGLPLEEALAKSRIHQQWRPDMLFVEANMPAGVRQELVSRGHKLKEMGPYGSTQAIALDAQGTLIAVSEPRLKARNK